MSCTERLGSRKEKRASSMNAVVRPSVPAPPDPPNQAKSRRRRRRRKPKARQGSAEMGSPAGVPDTFPWGSLPFDLQESIMSKLAVEDTARFTCAIRSRDARAVHRDMMLKRYEAARKDLHEKHLRGKSAAVFMLPFDVASPRIYRRFKSSRVRRR